MSEEDIDLWKCYNCESYKEKHCYQTNKETKYDNTCSFFKIKTFDEENICEYKPLTLKEYKLKLLRIEKSINLFIQDKIRIAEEFYKIQPFFYDRSGMFWIWNFNNSSWQIMDEYDLLNYLRKCNGQGLSEITKNSFWSEVNKSLKLVGRDHIPKETKNTWIQFNKTIYDYKTKKKINSTPKYFNTNPIPYDLVTGEQTPTIDKIFSEWVGEEKVKLLKEIIAYCMISDYPLHRIFCLTGSGLNGKGVFLRLIRKIIGELNCSSTELDLLMNSRFEIGKVYRKLVCQMGETNFSEISKTSMLKKLTGQDLIGIEFKNKQPFDYVNYAKLIIATNSLPPTMDKTDGFYRRWLIIDFPNKFPEGVDVLSLIPEREINALIGQCVEMIPLIIKRGKFIEEGSIKERMRIYEQKSNPLNEFITEHYKKDVNGKVPIFDFEDKYNSYLSERGLRTLTRRRLSNLLKETGFDIERENVQKENGEWTKWSFIFGLSFLDTLDT